MYTAILLNKSFTDEDFVSKSLEIIQEKIYTDSDWIVYEVKITDEDIKMISDAMTSGPWYNHAFNDDKVIVIFKNKIFEISKDDYNLSIVIEYSKHLDIPTDQMNIKPVNKRELEEYFALD